MTKEELEILDRIANFVGYKRSDKAYDGVWSYRQHTLESVCFKENEPIEHVVGQMMHRVGKHEHEKQMAIRVQKMQEYREKFLTLTEDIRTAIKKYNEFETNERN